MYFLGEIKHTYLRKLKVRAPNFKVKDIQRDFQNGYENWRSDVSMEMLHVGHTFWKNEKGTHTQQHTEDTYETN